MRMLPLVRDRYRIYALSHSPDRFARMRDSGVMPILGDLDRAATLAPLAGLATDVVHTAPPQPRGKRDFAPRASSLRWRRAKVYHSNSST